MARINAGEEEAAQVARHKVGSGTGGEAGTNADDDDDLALLSPFSDNADPEDTTAAAVRTPAQVACDRRPLLTWQQLPAKLWVHRGTALLISIALVMVGVAIRVAQSKLILCSSLPEVAHASEVCNGFSSLLAGQHCGVHCEAGFNATGRFECDASGKLSMLAQCL